MATARSGAGGRSSAAACGSCWPSWSMTRRSRRRAAPGSWLGPGVVARLRAVVARRAVVDVDAIAETDPVVDRDRVGDRHAQAAVAGGIGGDVDVSVDRVAADE